MNAENHELLNTLIEECKDLIERIRNAMDGLMNAPDRAERIGDIFRCIHTIKGGAGACELDDIKTIAHHLESRLVELKKTPDSLSSSDISAIDSTVDQIESWLENPNRQKVQTNGGDSQGFQIFDEPAHTATHEQKVESRPHQPAVEQIRVGLDRVQKNFDIVSEIFLTRNQMKYLVERKAEGSLSDEEFYHSWEVLDGSLRKSIGELETVALSMRMTSLKNLFKRMEKTVRTYAEQSGKSIEVALLGVDTELDKKIVDTLAEPLIHLTRNAMDHGIETNDARKQSGKRVPARIEISSEVVGNEVLVRVRDDGKGIDHKSVLESAKRKGLDVSHVRNSDDAINLIFIPGFSTRDAATDVSGRGVGMDAVKTYVESFGGTIGIQTRIGEGSVFTMRLPLGMSLLSSLIATLNNQTVALSLAGVTETKSVRYSEIHSDGKGKFFKLNGNFVPCVDVREYLFNEREVPRLANSEVGIVVCETAVGATAFCFDSIVENTEIVLKQLPKVFLQPKFVTGVSILPTGDPVTVVSLPLLQDWIAKGELGAHAKERKHG